MKKFINWLLTATTLRLYSKRDIEIECENHLWEFCETHCSVTETPEYKLKIAKEVFIRAQMRRNGRQWNSKILDDLDGIYRFPDYRRK